MEWNHYHFLFALVKLAYLQYDLLVLLELESLVPATGTEGCWEVEWDVAGWRVSERMP